MNRFRFYYVLICIVVSLLFSETLIAQQATIIKFEKLQKLLNAHSGPIQIINFWATWCAPCVNELPLLEKIHAKENLNIKITLVSLDYADKVGNVNAFIKRKNIQSNVLLLDEIDYNSWIDKVDKHWSGAIPATLIFNPETGQRKLLERELQEGELERLIDSLK